ncbi:MAG: MBL fold metallo-hydrolase [Candidatus Schekmanbacteria bacterium]|nr:MBL fold metallo-hydrolase [Candidatus Schekmanbacteria bacterium]
MNIYKRLSFCLLTCLMFLSSYINISHADITCESFQDNAIVPKPDRLTIMHLALTHETQKGQSTLIVGPTGITALMDVAGDANNNDEDYIVSKISAVNTIINNDFRDENNNTIDKDLNEVDYVIITHMHGDHMANFDDLFGGANPRLKISNTVPGKTYKGKLVYRGFYDWYDDSAESAKWEIMYDTVYGGNFTDKIFKLCSGTEGESPSSSARYPATNCYNLERGDIQLPDDTESSTNLTSFIDLGMTNTVQSKLYIYGADRWIRTTATNNSDWPHAPSAGTNKENEASIVGILNYGNFRYAFGGDLLGNGAGANTEQYIVNNIADLREEGTSSTSLIGYDNACYGVDVYLAHHYGKDSSSQESFVDMLLPDNTSSKQVIVGLKKGYDDAPERAAIWRLLGYSETNCNGLPTNPDRSTGPRVDTSGRVWLTRDGGNTTDCTGKPYVDYGSIVCAENASGNGADTIIQTEPPTSYGGTNNVKKYVTKYYVSSTKKACKETVTVEP